VSKNCTKTTETNEGHLRKEGQKRKRKCMMHKREKEVIRKNQRKEGGERGGGV
jgi:hypothetical protein